MNAFIITIGDEILIGQIVDTNSAWLGQQFSALGIKVHKIVSVSDNSDEIKNTLSFALNESDIIIITGGLGPTKDDLTKHTLASFFNAQLVLNSEVLKDITDLFASLGKSVTELNRLQAMVPDNCIVLRNKRGTAPGMAWLFNGKLVVSLPGVPYEMKSLFEQSVIPLINQNFQLPAIEHLTLLTQGIGESALAEKISVWEENLPANVKLAYLPSVGMVKLRLSAYGTNKEELVQLTKSLANQVIPLLGNHFFGYNNQTLEEVVANFFFKSGKTLALAESCTGGAISSKITKISGCSSFYKGGIVSYANEIKENVLGVNKQTLQKYGAVSKQVVEEMLIGIKNLFNTDYAVAVSGIAGPLGGTSEKPVGTVWIGVMASDYQDIKEYKFGNDREINIERAALTALNRLRIALLNKE